MELRSELRIYHKIYDISKNSKQSGTAKRISNLPEGWYDTNMIN
jgi:hypothetical protein